MKGRLIYHKQNKILIQNFDGIHDFEVSEQVRANIGDLVEYKDQKIIVLTPNNSPNKSLKYTNRILNPRRLKALQMRQKIEFYIREYFLDQNFIETKTPMLVRSPGMEAHIRPYQLSTGEFIPTSPEFAMKKLLVGGLEKIFQICPAFRYEPASSRHHPEFSILEWYRAYSDIEQIMLDFESLVEFLALKIFNKPVIQYKGQVISVQTPWKRCKVRDLFKEYTNIDLVQANTKDLLAAEATKLNLSIDESDSWDDVFYKIWIDKIECVLPTDQAYFVYRYPPSQAALSVLDQDEDLSTWAKRFEPYVGGLELGNAFEELTDPVEQRARFLEEIKLRQVCHGDEFPMSPMDESFMDALNEGMPPSGGIAVGVDRLVMLFADEPDIDYTIWLQSYVHS